MIEIMDYKKQKLNSQSGRMESQSGQVGIIVLLIVAVILTIAISLSQRTVQ